MDYNLTRVDYMLSGITFPDTLKLLPVSEFGTSKLQKFAVGDKNGVLQCIAIKDEEPVVQFKTLPGKPITSIQLASTSGVQSDKIFAASGNEVKGYTRKGKVFFTIETSLSETITAMSVIGGDLILGSGKSIIFYRDGKEFNSYTCDDRVLDLAAFSIPNSIRIRLMILEANKEVIVLDGNNQLSKTFISSGPTKLFVPPTGNSHACSALYGSVDGSIGLIEFDGSSLITKCLIKGGSLGPVMCMGWFVNEAGPHLAVGRHDGSIQLYSVNLEDFADSLRLKFTYFCGEPVTSVAGGCVSSEESELMASTFSGRIFALRQHNHVNSLSSSMATVSLDALTLRRNKLEAEVLRLEKQANVEREKYQKTTRTINISGVSVPPLLDLQCELSGVIQNGWQEIRIMIAVPLDMLFVYCKQSLDIETDSAAVLSICPSQSPACALMATVRCQSGTRRLWIRVRYPKNLETQTNSSKLTIYALPAGAPRVARMISLKLPFMPYYSQYEDLQSVENRNEGGWCELNVSGKFSTAEITSWLSEALPGELPRPSSLVAFARSHSLMKTILICRYQKNKATFKCEDISTVDLLKNLLSNRSVEKGLRIEIDCDIPQGFCLKQFKKIEEQFKHEFSRYKDHNLLKMLQSLDLDSNPSEFEGPLLCEEYMSVLKTSDDHCDVNFEELLNIISSWYESWSTLLLRPFSVSATEKRQLGNALKSCDVEEIKRIFSN